MGSGIGLASCEKLGFTVEAAATTGAATLGALSTVASSDGLDDEKSWKTTL